MNTLFTVMRFLTLGFWLLACLSVLSIFPDNINTLLQVAALAIIGAHLLELFIFNKLLKSHESPLKGKINIMIYGVFWALPHLKNGQ